MTPQQRAKMEALAEDYQNIHQSVSGAGLYVKEDFIAGFTAAIEMQNEQIAQLQQDRESLKKLAADYKRKNGFANNHIKDLKEKLAASQEQLAKAEEALRFYADKNNWNSGRSLDDSRDVTVILDDDERTTNKFYYGGKRAREYFTHKNEGK